MRELVGDEDPTQYFQPLTPGRGFERSVIDVGDELGGDQDVQTQAEPSQPTQAREHEVSLIGVFARDPVVFHEGGQQGRMSLLLANE
jgi:hypothetical protein